MLTPRVSQVVPLVVIGLGGFSVLDLYLRKWEGGAVAVALIALTTVSWLLAPELQRSEVVFLILALGPLLVLHVAGGALGIAAVESAGPQASLMFLPFAAAAVSCAPFPRFSTVARLALITGIVVGRCVVADELVDFAPWFCGIALGAASGRALRRYDTVLGEMRAAQAMFAATSRNDERRRIARDIHDAVSQSLAVVLLHATAARMNLDDDPHLARNSLEQAERVGRSGLAEVRNRLQVLRSDDLGQPLHEPGLAELGALVGSFRAAGVDIDDRINLPVRPVDRCGAATYRIVQESLANAVVHGAGSIALSVVGDEREVRVHVENDVDVGAPERGLRQGLVGMSERCDELGGSFDTRMAPIDGGASRWLLDARLPWPAEGEGALQRYGIHGKAV